jgi:radical SAM superfamily enzyme YgiQ (UPF0313 family)
MEGSPLIQIGRAGAAGASKLATAASRKLRHAIAINVSYPCRRNGRGKLVLPEMRVGAATLPLLAAIVTAARPACEVRQYDEIGTPIDFDYIDGLPREATLILLSVSTNLAGEARLLSRRFQALGFATVIGGPHASACLDEVAGYANAAVQGEAESQLPHVIDAFEAGTLTAQTVPGLKLRSGKDSPLERSPIPDRSMYRHSRHYMNPGVLEFGRGCQYRCSFCASTNLYTQSLRHKTNGQVLAEIATLPEYPGGRRVWFFGDDNFASSHARAKSLSREIGRFYPKARWGCAMTIASARDPELLDTMVAGGMRYAFIGFDSIVKESLASARKNLARTDHYSPLVAELKKRGIFVVAALVFGFDHDHLDVFQRTLRWAEESGVDTLNLNVLRPYPSSPDYRQLKAEGRLLEDPWWLAPFERRLELVHGLTLSVSSVMTTFQPRHMSARDLAAGTLWVGQEFSRPRRALPRLLRGWQGWSTFLVDLFTNLSYGQNYSSHGSIGDPWRPEAPPVGTAQAAFD